MYNSKMQNDYYIRQIMRPLSLGLFIIMANGCATDTKQPPDKSAQTANCAVSEDSQSMLTIINSYRASGRYCGDDYMPPVSALRWNCTLQTVALGHSLDMANNNFHSHNGSDGLSPGERLTNTGYRWGTYAENIAAGLPTAEGTIKGWIKSTGHCLNLMKSDVSEVGMASAENPASDYNIYWTQIFASPTNLPTKTHQSLPTFK